MGFIGNPAPLSPLGTAKAAQIIGCDEVALRAVLQVETGSKGFDKQGRPKALFEPHIFYRLLKSLNDTTALARAERIGLAYPKWGSRPYPADSYPRIDAACAVNEEIALQATSWGLPQILGLNYAAAGYSSAKAMIEAFKTGEDEQLAAMARFIKAKGLDRALQRKDWAAFSKGYNGPAYKTHSYHVKLAKAYAAAPRGHVLGLADLPEADLELTPEVRNAAIVASLKRSRDRLIAGAGAAWLMAVVFAILTACGGTPFVPFMGGLVMVVAATLCALAALRKEVRAHLFVEAAT